VSPKAVSLGTDPGTSGAGQETPAPYPRRLQRLHGVPKTWNGLPRLAARRHACPKFPDNSQQGAAHHFSRCLSQRYLGACLRETGTSKVYHSQYRNEGNLLQQLSLRMLEVSVTWGASSTRAAKSHPFFHQPVTAVADIQDPHSLGRLPYSAPDDAAGIPLGLEHQDTLGHTQPSGESRQTSGVVSSSFKSHRQTHHHRHVLPPSQHSCVAWCRGASLAGCKPKLLCPDDQPTSLGGHRRVCTVETVSRPKISRVSVPHLYASDIRPFRPK
jgi:hypothetical protein